MTFKYFLVFSFLICQQVASSQHLFYPIRSTKQIYVYKEREFKGGRVPIDITNCSNIPSTHSSSVYSVNTANQCVRLYTSQNCLGTYIEVLPRSPCHNNLDKWNFGGRTRSAGPCPDKCSPQIIGNLTNTDVVTVQIFDRIDYKGAYRDITINGCTPIPNRFFHDLLSIQTNDQCIQLYNTPTCNLTGSKVDTIELRRGTPFHNDIKFTWPFPTTKAISTCKYKCDRLAALKSGEDNGSNLNELPSQGEIFLYHARYFEGNYLKISEYPFACVNITDDWEGLVESLKVENNTCVQLFDRRDCSGKNLTVSGSVADLAGVKFDGRTRSIKGCGGGENSFSRVINGQQKQQQRITGEESGKSEDVVIAVIILIGVGVVVVIVVWVVRGNKINYYGNIWGMEERIRNVFGGMGREGWSGFRNGGEGGAGVDGVMGENEGEDNNEDVFVDGNRQRVRNGNGFDLLA